MTFTERANRIVDQYALSGPFALPGDAFGWLRSHFALAIAEAVAEGKAEEQAACAETARHAFSQFLAGRLWGEKIAAAIEGKA